jgi:DNA-binding phage protein
MLPKQGNPEFRNLWTLLKALGLKFSVEAEAADARKKAA